MKRLFVVIGSLLALPAFAEVEPQYLYDEGILITEEEVAPVVADEQPAPAADTSLQQQSRPTAQTYQRGAQTSRTSSRTTVSRTGNVQNDSRRAATIRSARGVSARSAATARNTNNRQTVARVGVGGTATVAASMSGTNSTTSRISSLGSSDKSLYNAQTYGTRSSGVRMATTNVVANNNTSTTDTLDNIVEMTDYCKAQYALCMDNYCNVLDDNQGRCSCSANLQNYAKTEAALAEATEALQDIAQEIQYIGLSAEEVETLFSQTEAEIALAGSNDTSELQSNLDKIKRMIVDVQSGKSRSSGVTATSGIAMDLSGLLDFSFDSNGFDLSSLLTTAGATNNTSSISNQRGANLYKTAAARCKASVLNTCANQGGDISIVTNAYDLEIDKACFAYERALTDANNNMNATVRNAKSVLQKARLMVAQNKNVYDLRGCVEALDSCMQSDFVCGSDYESCLDTTGKYIVDGQVLVGSEPGKTGDTKGLYADTWGATANSPWGSSNLTTYIKDKIATTAITTASNDMATYLQYRIGYHSDSDNRNYGMCVSVLNQCQNYTYEKGTDGKSKYKNDNMVIKEYLTRTLPRIKAAQDQILAEYAEDCITDVESCLTANNYRAIENPDTAANKIAINACKATITTCQSVNLDVSASVDDVKTWVKNVMDGIYSNMTTE
ncbi:MAG: hypothetical protein KBS86_00570 [Proteobacteria bacterium]|nr:hypothetical protein [Candidatus Enterousia scatequi]